MSDDSRLKLAAFNLAVGGWNLCGGFDSAFDGRPIMACVSLIIGGLGLFAGFVTLRR